MSRLINSLAHLLPELARTLRSPRVTVRFPFTPAELPEHYRGRVVADSELCKGCGQCARRCPSFALVLEREDRDHFRLIHYLDRCTYCGSCQEACNFNAIQQVNEFAQACQDREDFVTVLVEKA